MELRYDITVDCTGVPVIVNTNLAFLPLFSINRLSNPTVKVHQIMYQIHIMGYTVEHKYVNTDANRDTGLERQLIGRMFIHQDEVGGMYTWLN